MARGANQKLKLLYLKQFFEEHTDEEHPATMQQILDYLKVNGVDAERKSIYTDLDDHFEVIVTVVVSPQFYAWVFGLEDNVTITAPDSVVKQMKDMLAKVSKRYDNEKA